MSDLFEFNRQHSVTGGRCFQADEQHEYVSVFSFIQMLTQDEKEIKDRKLWTKWIGLYRYKGKLVIRRECALQGTAKW